MAEETGEYRHVDGVANEWGKDKTLVRGPKRADLKRVANHLRDVEEQNGANEEGLLWVMAGEAVSQNLRRAMTPLAVNDMACTFLFSAIGPIMTKRNQMTKMQWLLATAVPNPGGTWDAVVLKMKFAGGLARLLTKDGAWLTDPVALEWMGRYSTAVDANQGTIVLVEWEAFKSRRGQPVQGPEVEARGVVRQAVDTVLYTPRKIARILFGETE